jgi:hypothetical protein
LLLLSYASFRSPLSFPLPPPPIPFVGLASPRFSSFLCLLLPSPLGSSLLSSLPFHLLELLCGHVQKNFVLNGRLPISFGNSIGVVKTK